MTGAHQADLPFVEPEPKRRRKADKTRPERGTKKARAKRAQRHNRDRKKYTYGHTDLEVEFFNKTLLDYGTRKRSELDYRQIEMAEKFVAEEVFTKYRVGGEVYYEVDSEAYFRGDDMNRFFGIRYDLNESIGGCGCQNARKPEGCGSEAEPE